MKMTLRQALEQLKLYIDFYLENDDEDTDKNLVKYRIIQNSESILVEMAHKLIDFIEKSTGIDMIDIHCKIQELLNNQEINITTYTLKDYLQKVRAQYPIPSRIKINNWSDLSDKMNNYTNSEIWAYPVYEYNYCLEEEKNICAVVISYDTQEIALAEIY